DATAVSDALCNDNVWPGVACVTQTCSTLPCAENGAGSAPAPVSATGARANATVSAATPARSDFTWGTAMPRTLARRWTLHTLGGYGTSHGRVRIEEVRHSAAPAQGRRAGARCAAHGRRRRLLHRRADPDLRRDQSVASGRARTARRAPRALC